MNSGAWVDRARLFCAMLLTSLLLACGGASEADKAASDAVLLIGNGSEPKGLDPHLVTGVPEAKLLRALHEGLVTAHPTDDGSPAPGVAESWTVNDDFTVWTFKLRAAKWANGDPVTAGDFVYSWQRMLSPALGAEYAEMLYVIANGRAFHQGETSDFSQVGAKALDDRTLEVRLAGATPHFLGMLIHTSFLPVNPKVVEANGGMTNRQSGWSTLENHVGNGPFRLTKWVTNQVIEMERNPNYWDAATVKLNGLRFYPVDNVNTEETMFRNGRLHITSTVSPDKIPTFQREMPDQMRIDPYLGTYFYRLNVTRKPFDDVRVRRALALAIDRRLLVERVTKGGQAPATGFTPAGIDGYAPFKTVQYNAAEAKRLLAEAGYPGGRGFPAAEILINTSESHAKIAQAIQAMWKETLGIDIGIYNQEWKVYLDSQSSLNYQISRAGWIGDYIHPTSFLDIFTSGNGNNDTGWTNARYDALIEQARAATSEDERMALLRQAEALLLKDMPIVPIYWYTLAYLRDPRVAGWNANLLDQHPYKHVSLRAE